MIETLYGKLEKNGIHPNEEILWFGQPADRRLFREGDTKILLTSIIWNICIIYAIGLVQEGGSALNRSIILILLYILLIRGLYYGVIRLFIRRRESENTFYMITKERILVVVNTFRVKVSIMKASDIYSVKGYQGLSPYEAVCINYKESSHAFMDHSSLNFMKLSQSKSRFILYDLEDATRVIRLIESICQQP